MKRMHALLGFGSLAEGSRPNNFAPVGGADVDVPDFDHPRGFGSVSLRSTRSTASVDCRDAHLLGVAVPVHDRRPSDTVVIIQGRRPAVLETKDAVLHTLIALTGGILE
jgi:hypothetical protein